MSPKICRENYFVKLSLVGKWYLPFNLRTVLLVVRTWCKNSKSSYSLTMVKDSSVSDPGDSLLTFKVYLEMKWEMYQMEQVIIVFVTRIIYYVLYSVPIFISLFTKFNREKRQERFVLVLFNVFRVIRICWKSQNFSFTQILREIKVAIELLDSPKLISRKI